MSPVCTRMSSVCHSCVLVCHLYVTRIAHMSFTSHSYVLICYPYLTHMYSYVFFSIRVFFTDTDDSQFSRGSEGTIFYSTLPLPPAHEHWDIYLQLCMWDDYHVFLIATLVDLPPYRITIWVIDWWYNVCFFTGWIDTRFLLQPFDIGNRWIWTRIDYHPCITSEPTKSYSEPSRIYKIKFFEKIVRENSQWYP